MLPYSCSLPKIQPEHAAPCQNSCPFGSCAYLKGQRPNPARAKQKENNRQASKQASSGLLHGRERIKRRWTCMQAMHCRHWANKSNENTAICDQITPRALKSAIVTAGASKGIQRRSREAGHARRCKSEGGENNAMT